MKKVVVTQEIRPDIDERWNRHEVITFRDLILEERAHGFPTLEVDFPSQESLKYA